VTSAVVGNPAQPAAAPGGSLSLAACIVKMRYRVIGVSSVSRDVVVYTAEDVRSGRPVALEVVREEFAANADFVAAVREQANKLAKSSHVHRAVAQVYECDTTDDGQFFLALQQTHGDTLRDVLSARGSFDPLAALRIGSQIGEALETLHHTGILHGELRPDSVLLVRDDEGIEHVKLIGVELTAAHRTMIGLCLRDTVLEAYLAPEQIEHGETTEATDVYALGRLVQELITGQPPSPDSNGWHGAPETPPAIHGIIARAVEASPARRYSNMTLMINDMWSALSELQQPDRQRSAPPRLVDAGRRRSYLPRSFVRAAGMIAIGGLILGAIGWAAGREGSVSLLRTGTVTPPFVAAPVKSQAVQPLNGPPVGDRATGERDSVPVPSSPLPTHDGPTPAVSVPTPALPTRDRAALRPVVSASTPPSPTGDGVRPSPAVSSPKPPTAPLAAESRPRPSPKGPSAAALRDQTPARSAPQVSPVQNVPHRRPDPVAPAPPTESERPATDAGDGSAIIDWLFKERRGGG
jgi:serine/threonine protein kinase